ncbi:hypothetical protein BGY98DRAFT_1001975 [Russula aff. rugulosa BPL654]|nr:hypothetical protein BGY98DRAFT_1001975 [Russula aff. rugulosa BPL654]
MLCFESPRPLLEWERRRPSSSTRALLPSLVDFTFRGVSEYLEVIVDRIDAPLLDRVKIESSIDQYLTPHNSHSSSAAYPSSRLAMKQVFALVEIGTLLWSSIHFQRQLPMRPSCWRLARQPDFHLSSLVQLCPSLFPQALIPSVERLIIVGMYFSRPLGQDGDSLLWRELLQPFTAVKDLCLSPEIAPHIALILLDLVGESVMELLPVLQNIVLKDLQPSGLVPEGIEQFVAARQLASHPVSVSRWAGEY